MATGGRVDFFMASVSSYTIRSGKTRYFVRWVDGAGVRRTQRGFASRKAAQAFGDDAETRGRRVKHGLETAADQKRREAAGRSIDAHLADYLQSTQAMSSPRHVAQVRSSIEAMVTACGWTSIAEISADGAAKEFGRRLREGKSDARRRGVGPSTLNHHRTYLRSFTAWLARNGRLAADPLAALGRFDAKADVRRVRRILTDAEITALLAAADESRRMLYLLMLYTGLRVGEVRSLRASSFRWDHPGGPVVVVEAGYSKRRRREEQPLPETVAFILRPWIKARPARGPIWTLPHDPAAMLRRDLTAAKIEYRDADGHVIDMHALRHTYISRVVAGGATVKEAQTLARHSAAALTLDRYAHVDAAAVRGALERSLCAPRTDAKLPATDGNDQTETDSEQGEKALVLAGKPQETEEVGRGGFEPPKAKPSDLQSEGDSSASTLPASRCASSENLSAPHALHEKTSRGDSRALERGAERRHPLGLPDARTVLDEAAAKVHGLLDADHSTRRASLRSPEAGGVEP